MSLKQRLIKEALQFGSKGKSLVDDLLRQIPVGRGVTARPGPVIPKGGVDPRAASLGQVPDRIRQTSTGAGFRGRVPDTWPTTGPNVAPGTTVPRATLGSGNNPIVGPRVINPQGGGLPKITAGGIFNNSLRALGGYGVVDKLSKGNYKGAATDALLMAPAKYLAGAAGIFGVMEGFFPASVADGTMASAPKLTAEQIKKANKVRAEQGLSPLGSNSEVNNTQQPSLLDSLPPEMRPKPVPEGPTPINPPLEDMTGLEAAQVPPGLPIRPDRETPNLNPVTQENGQLTTPIDLPAPPADPRMAPTPEQNVGAMDPYAYQLQVYGQGRQAAASQSAQAAVRDLGLSIHQRLYPQFYADKDNIATSENQLPNSMTIKDSQSELGAATLAVEELIDPSILEQLNAMNLRRTGY